MVFIVFCSCCTWWNIKNLADRRVKKMSKTSERLEAYQTQMSIYAEQHKIILASDVLDMIEQLQDDLKDDINNAIAELKDLPKDSSWNHNSDNINRSDAIDIVRKGGVG